MSRADSIEIFSALAQLPDRTPEQRCADELAVVALQAAEDLWPGGAEMDMDEYAAEWAVERLHGVRLSKAARAAVAGALGVEPEDLIA